MISTSRLRVPTILQLILSSLGFLAAGLVSLLVFVAAFGSLGPKSQGSAMELFSLAWLSLVVAGIMLFSMYFSIRRLLDRPVTARQTPRNFLISSLLMLVWPLLLLAGGWVAGQSSAWLLRPPLQLAVSIIPLWWLVEFGRRGLRSGSPQRSWGLLSASLAVTMPLAIVLEVLMLGVLLLGLAFWLGAHPTMMHQMQTLVQQLNLYRNDPQMAIEALRPYLSQPWVNTLLLVTMAGLVPMLEELLKPLVMWVMVGWKLEPSEGFAAGLICGAAFALLETVTALSSADTGSWAMLAVERAGTGMLHVLTAGLVGWGLASAWRGKFLRLAGAYLAAVGLHAAWNGSSLGLGIVPVLGTVQDQSSAPAGFQVILIVGLMALMLVIFFLVNRQLRRQQPVLPEPLTVDVTSV
jgi:hypothetical protein